MQSSRSQKRPRQTITPWRLEAGGSNLSMAPPPRSQKRPRRDNCGGELGLGDIVHENSLVSPVRNVDLFEVNRRRDLPKLPPWWRDRRRLSIFIICVLLVIGAIIGAVIGVMMRRHCSQSTLKSTSNQTTTMNQVPGIVPPTSKRIFPPFRKTSTPSSSPNATTMDSPSQPNLTSGAPGNLPSATVSVVVTVVNGTTQTLSVPPGVIANVIPTTLGITSIIQDIVSPIPVISTSIPISRPSPTLEQILPGEGPNMLPPPPANPPTESLDTSTQTTTTPTLTAIITISPVSTAAPAVQCPRSITPVESSDTVTTGAQPSTTLVISGETSTSAATSIAISPTVETLSAETLTTATSMVETSVVTSIAETSTVALSSVESSIVAISGVLPSTVRSRTQTLSSSAASTAETLGMRVSINLVVPSARQSLPQSDATGPTPLNTESKAFTTIPSIDSSFSGGQTIHSRRRSRVLPRV